MPNGTAVAAPMVTLCLMAKKKWSDLSPAQQRLVVVGAAVEAVLTTIALVDLVRRPASSVRGPKVLWALGCFVQPVGPIAYLAVGRKSLTIPAIEVA